MQDDVDTPYGICLTGTVDNERHSNNEEEEDEDKEDEEEENEDEEKDKKEDDGKEPETIGQGEIVSTSPDDVDIMVHDKPILLPEQGQELHKLTPWPQPLAQATQP